MEAASNNIVSSRLRPVLRLIHVARDVLSLGEGIIARCTQACEQHVGLWHGCIVIGQKGDSNDFKAANTKHVQYSLADVERRR